MTGVRDYQNVVIPRAISCCFPYVLMLFLVQLSNLFPRCDEKNTTGVRLILFRPRSPDLQSFSALQRNERYGCASDFFPASLSRSPGGLPVAKGVFVGDPVTQSSYGPSGGGGGAYNPSATQATVITSAPPGYQNHVVAAAAVAAAASGDGRGIAIPHQGSGQHTVIVMNGPPGNQFGEWGRAPQPFVCRACGFSGSTATMTVRDERG